MLQPTTSATTGRTSSAITAIRRMGSVKGTIRRRREPPDNEPSWRRPRRLAYDRKQTACTDGSEYDVKKNRIAPAWKVRSFSLQGQRAAVRSAGRARCPRPLSVTSPGRVRRAAQVPFWRRLSAVSSWPTMGSLDRSCFGPPRAHWKTRGRVVSSRLTYRYQPRGGTPGNSHSIQRNFHTRTVAANRPRWRHDSC
jgi:hypothetical protein